MPVVTTTSEGLAGYIGFRTTIDPKVTGREFVFELADADAARDWESEYARSEHSTVQTLVVMYGKRRRELKQC